MLDLKERILSSVNILDVVSRYVELKPSGEKYRGLSPFKPEKTPSFFVDPEKNFFYCFSTQKGGDIFTFIEEVESLNFKEALKFLADLFRIEDTSDFNTNHSKPNEREKLYKLLEGIKDTYVGNLDTNVRQILYDRGLDDDDIKKWEIGHAKDVWNEVCRMDKKEELLKTGVCVENKNKFYDRFRKRIMFPFHDVYGNIIGFTGRDISGRKETPKYVNISETNIFNKSEYLYGLYFARQNIKKNNLAILVEGQFDVILSHKVGYPVSVASSGTALTKSQLLHISRLTKNLLIAFDNDEAGFNATLKVIKLAIGFGFNIRVFDGVEGKDPADIIQANKGRFKQGVKDSKPYLEYLTAHIKKVSNDDGVKILKNTKDILFPTLAILTNKDDMLIDLSLKTIASEFGYSHESVKKDFDRYLSGLKDSLYETNSIAKQDVDVQRDRLKERIKRALLAKTYLENTNIKIDVDISDRLEVVFARNKNMCRELEENTKLDEVAAIFVEQEVDKENETYELINIIKDCLENLENEYQKAIERKKLIEYSLQK